MFVCLSSCLSVCLYTCLSMCVNETDRQINRQTRRQTERQMDRNSAMRNMSSRTAPCNNQGLGLVVKASARERQTWV